MPDANKDAYIALAARAWPLFKEYGALQHVEAWGRNVPDGKTTDFKRAVALEDGESVVFSWVAWPDKVTADRCEASMRTDERWQQMDMSVVDGKRMIFGGFETVFEQSS